MLSRAALAAAVALLVALAPALGRPAAASTAATPANASVATDVAVAPKVVIVVGATEGTTASYRTMADSIAAEAVKWTPNVVKVYSPNATWAAVKAAATGASIFVYLGHGNGFPSPYSTVPKPDTQNGMGLNTTLGLSDSDKKYYGEQYLAAELRLAKNSVVFLNHLCYAPGASEPGNPEPTIGVAKQRVDNFASGFIRAGARAVFADDYTTSVQTAIRAIFTTHQSMQSVWRSMPGYHAHEIPWVPTRNPAFDATMDPETWTTGFTRSVVTDRNFQTDDVLAGAGLAQTDKVPGTLTVPGSAVVGAAGATVDTDQTLGTPAGPALAAGTKVRLDDLVDLGPATDGSAQAPAVQVHTFDSAVSGWVSGATLSPRDSAGPALWSMTGDTTVSPNYDGVNDQLALWGRLSEAVPWTATVKDAGGATVQTTTGTSDFVPIAWDGMVGGTPAPAGTYQWTLHAQDAWGNAPLDSAGDVTVVTLPVPTSAVLAFTSLNGANTNATSVAFQITFASDITGLTASDLSRSGTATGCVVNAPSGSATVWYVTVTACSAGTLALTLAANAVTSPDTTLGPPTPTPGPTVRIDRSAPTPSAPSTRLLQAVTLAGSTLQGYVSLGGTDPGSSGIARYDVARSVDASAFAVIATGVTGSLKVGLSNGHAYRFEVRATDRAGNRSGWAAGSTTTAALVQQSATTVTYAGSWTTASNSSYSGGTARRASTAGASASYAFTGRGFALVVTRHPSYGQLKVYVDGTYVQTVETAAAASAFRSVVYARALTYGTHTVKIAVVGTAGRPTVVFDAFEVLR